MKSNGTPNASASAKIRLAQTSRVPQKDPLNCQSISSPPAPLGDTNQRWASTGTDSPSFGSFPAAFPACLRISDPRSANVNALNVSSHLSTDLILLCECKNQNSRGTTCIAHALHMHVMMWTRHHGLPGEMLRLGGKHADLFIRSVPEARVESCLAPCHATHWASHGDAATPWPEASTKCRGHQRLVAFPQLLVGCKEASVAWKKITSLKF